MKNIPTLKIHLGDILTITHETGLSLPDKPMYLAGEWKDDDRILSQIFNNVITARFDHEIKVLENILNISIKPEDIARHRGTAKKYLVSRFPALEGLKLSPFMGNEEVYAIQGEPETCPELEQRNNKEIQNIITDARNRLPSNYCDFDGYMRITPKSPELTPPGMFLRTEINLN